MRTCKGDCNQGRKDCPHPFLCIRKVSEGGGPLGAPATQQCTTPWWIWLIGVCWLLIIAAAVLGGCSDGGAHDRLVDAYADMDPDAQHKAMLECIQASAGMVQGGDVVKRCQDAAYTLEFQRATKRVEGRARVQP